MPWRLPPHAGTACKGKCSPCNMFGKMLRSTVRSMLCSQWVLQLSLMLRLLWLPPAGTLNLLCNFGELVVREMEREQVISDSNLILSAGQQSVALTARVGPHMAARTARPSYRACRRAALAARAACPPYPLCPAQALERLYQEAAAAKSPVDMAARQFTGVGTVERVGASRGLAWARLSVCVAGCGTQRRLQRPGRRRTVQARTLPSPRVQATRPGAAHSVPAPPRLLRLQPARCRASRRLCCSATPASPAGRCSTRTSAGAGPQASVISAGWRPPSGRPSRLRSGSRRVTPPPSASPSA